MKNRTRIQHGSYRMDGRSEFIIHHELDSGGRDWVLIVESELQGKLLALYKRIVVPHLA